MSPDFAFSTNREIGGHPLFGPGIRPSSFYSAHSSAPNEEFMMNLLSDRDRDGTLYLYVTHEQQDRWAIFQRINPSAFSLARAILAEARHIEAMSQRFRFYTYDLFCMLELARNVLDDEPHVFSDRAIFDWSASIRAEGRDTWRAMRDAGLAGVFQRYALSVLAADRGMREKVTEAIVRHETLREFFSMYHIVGDERLRLSVLENLLRNYHLSREDHRLDDEHIMQIIEKNEVVDFYDLIYEELADRLSRDPLSVTAPIMHDEDEYSWVRQLNELVRLECAIDD